MVTGIALIKKLITYDTKKQ